MCRYHYSAVAVAVFSVLVPVPGQAPLSASKAQAGHQIAAFITTSHTGNQVISVDVRREMYAASRSRSLHHIMGDTVFLLATPPK